MKFAFCLTLTIAALLAEVQTKSCGVAPCVLLSSGKDMPRYGFGTWLGVTKEGQGHLVPVKDDSVEKAVSWAIDAGYRHIDTAAIYKTEGQVGAAVNKKIQEGAVTRDQLFITTKLWNDAHAQKEVVPALRESLKNLNLSYVDLYLIHWPTGMNHDFSFNDIDYVETWKGMVEAKKLGLARSIGVSNFNIQQLERLSSSTDEKPAVLQIEVNLHLQQEQLRKYCKENNIIIMAYTPFGSLFYSKAAKDAPPPRVDDPALVKIAETHNKTVTQISLRYLVELDVVPIPKSVTKNRIEENLKVFDFELTADEKDVLKSFNHDYRTVLPVFLEGSKYYPFERSNSTKTN